MKLLKCLEVAKTYNLYYVDEAIKNIKRILEPTYYISIERYYAELDELNSDLKIIFKDNNTQCQLIDMTINKIKSINL